MQNKRITIGVLINEILGRYQSIIAEGIIDFAKSKDVNLIFFNGTSISTPHEHERPLNIVYRLANPEQLDGLIVSGSLANYIGMEGLLKFLEPYRSIPMVTIAFPIEGIPTVLVNNRFGIKEALSHFYHVHGYKKIAFIRGPYTNPEAEERFSAYKDFLAENDLPMDNSMIYQGDFNYKSGKVIADKILEEGFDFEAMVASNDTMANALIDNLTPYGISVPGDFALIGYDNIKEAQVQSPTLTTVHQPLNTQGYQSCQTIFNILTGEKVSKKIMLEPNLIIRESCGCFPMASSRDNIWNSQETSIIIKSRKNAVNFNELTDFREISNQISGLVYQSLDFLPERNNGIRMQIPLLLKMLFADINSRNDSDSYLFQLKGFLSKAIQENRDIQVWQTVLQRIGNVILHMIVNKEDILKAHDLLQRGQILVARMIKRSEAAFNAQLTDLFWNLRFFMDKMNAIYNLEELMKELPYYLPFIRISSCYIILYRKALKNEFMNDWEIPMQSELHLAFDNKKNHLADNQKKLFFTSNLLPDRFIDREKSFIHIVEPISNTLYQFGYVVSSFISHLEEHTIYKTFRGLLSNTVHNSLLFKEREAAKRKLEEAVDELKQSEERFRNMAEFLPSIIIETDILMNVLFLNKAGFESFGIQDSNPDISFNFLNFVHPDDEPRLKDFIKRTIQNGSSDFNEFRFLAKNGNDLNLFCKSQIIYKEEMISGIRWNMINLKPLLTSIVLPVDSFFQAFSLSPREQDVLKQIIKGHKSKKIAENLFISEFTVKDHIKAIYSKIGVHSKEALFNKLKDYQIGQFGYNSFMYSLLASMLKE